MENNWFKQNTKKMCDHSRKFYWNNETYRTKKKLKMASVEDQPVQKRDLDDFLVDSDEQEEEEDESVQVKSP